MRFSSCGTGESGPTQSTFYMWREVTKAALSDVLAARGGRDGRDDDQSFDVRLYTSLNPTSTFPLASWRARRSSCLLTKLFPLLPGYWAAEIALRHSIRHCQHVRKRKSTASDTASIAASNAASNCTSGSCVGKRGDD